MPSKRGWSNKESNARPARMKNVVGATVLTPLVRGLRTWNLTKRLGRNMTLDRSARYVLRAVRSPEVRPEMIHLFLSLSLSFSLFSFSFSLSFSKGYQGYLGLLVLRVIRS